MSTKPGEELMMDISLQKDFNVFTSKSTLHLLNLIGDEILCPKAEEVAEELDCIKYRDHMKTLRKVIFPSPSKNENLTIHGFDYTIDRLTRLQPLKKLFCRSDGFYLVKKSFTEGVQYVKEGEVHTYKTIGRLLDIFISNNPLDLQTFRSSYDQCTKSERISQGETKMIPSNTYYVVIAPCHTFFIKEIKNISEFENSIQMPSLLGNEGDRHVTSVEERNESSRHTDKSDRINSKPSGSRDNERLNSTRPMELEIYDGVNDRASSKRSSAGKDVRQTKKKKSSTSGPRASPPPPNGNQPNGLNPPSSNSLRKQMELFSDLDTSNGDHGRAVFAIRKDKNIESYHLRSGSTFRILQDNRLTGSFAMENDDMDPYVIEYYGELQIIREVSKFKNGSTFETALTVQKYLLNELRDSTRKKEKVVVNYFFEYAFKAIEAAYKMFSEMRHTKMVGSCVPAIVPLSNARFFGPVSDDYESKP